jgi:hypothetical protein
MSFFARKLAVCLSLAMAGSAFAQGVTPQGAETSIIPGGLPGDQVLPDVAVTATGGFVVWQDNSVTQRGTRIRAARLDGSLIGGTPFSASSVWKSKTVGNQENPRVALLADGGAVIVWEGGGFVKNGSTRVRQIYARFLNANGDLVRSDIRVASHGTIDQTDPAVAVLSDGSVVVVWSSAGQDGSRLGIFAQRLTAGGAKLGVEFQVNQFTLNNQRTPQVAALSNGGFVIVWISELQRRVADVYGRLFDAQANPQSNEFFLNSGTDVCANPVVVASTDGGFAAAWSQRELPASFAPRTVVSSNSVAGSDTNHWDVFGRVFDATGAGNGSAFRLNTYTAGDQFRPRLSRIGSNYVAVWTSLRQDGSWDGVFGQAFTAEGTAAGSEFRVNTTTFHRQIQPAIGSDGESRLIAVWSSYIPDHSFDLESQIYVPGE